MARRSEATALPCTDAAGAGRLIARELILSAMPGRPNVATLSSGCAFPANGGLTFDVGRIPRPAAVAMKRQQAARRIPGPEWRCTMPV